MHPRYLLRTQQVSLALSISSPTIYLQVQQGILTPGVRLNQSVQVWPANEIAAIAQGRQAGLSIIKQQRLIQLLMQQREQDRQQFLNRFPELR